MFPVRKYAKSISRNAHYIHYIHAFKNRKLSSFNRFPPRGKTVWELFITPPLALMSIWCWIYILLRPEKIVGDYFHSMRLDDIDYSPMREVHNLVQHRQGKSIDRFIDRYNETYFRELVWTLEDRAWQMIIDPDDLRKLTQPFHLQG